MQVIEKEIMETERRFLSRLLSFRVRLEMKPMSIPTSFAPCSIAKEELRIGNWFFAFLNHCFDRVTIWTNRQVRWCWTVLLVALSHTAKVVDLCLLDGLAYPETTKNSEFIPFTSGLRVCA